MVGFAGLFIEIMWLRGEKKVRASATASKKSRQLCDRNDDKDLCKFPFLCP